MESELSALQCHYTFSQIKESEQMHFRMQLQLLARAYAPLTRVGYKIVSRLQGWADVSC